MDGPAIRQWLEALDAITYYELFRVEATAGHDTLRNAFHEFAETFHPDGHRWRPPSEQEAIARIYRRGAEAWRILSEPELRARYDEAVRNGILRPENIIVEMDHKKRSGAHARLVDQVRSPGARPFVLRAEELAKKGDPQQAKIQLVMALHMEKNNPALQAFAQELDKKLSSKPRNEK